MKRGTRAAAASRLQPPRLERGAAARQYILEGRAVTAPMLPGGLYLVATPIGNLRDITLRALETLAAADVIACEDTRRSRTLLHHYGIIAPMTPYHDHNADAARPKLIERLAQGAAIVLISDAGTPLISDPGYKLVREAQHAGAGVTAVPGPSAVLAALTVSGIASNRFLFEGFLPAKQAARRSRIAALKSMPATLILFETAPRIACTLLDLAEGLGLREAAICRELTKLHEEVRRGDLATVARHCAEQAQMRGEMVIVVAPPHRPEAMPVGELDTLLRAALDRGSLKEAVEEIVTSTGESRRTVYQRALTLRAGRT